MKFLWGAMVASSMTITCAFAPRPALADSPARLELLAQELALAPDAPLIVTFSSPIPVPPDSEVIVTAYTRVDERGRLGQYFDGINLSVIDQIRIPLSDVIQGADGSFTINVATGSSLRTPTTLTFPKAGVYPVVVDLSAGDQLLAELRTVAQRLPLADEAALPPLQISIAALLSERPALPGTSPDLAEQALNDIKALATLSPDARASLSLSPDLLNRLPASAMAPLRNTLQSNLLLSQPLYPFDPSVAADAGQSQHFTDLLVEGEDKTASVGETLPPNRSVWIAHDQLSPKGAALLRDLGVRLVVLPAEASLYADTTQLVQTTLPDGFNMPLAVIDLRMTDLFNRNLSTEQRALYGAADLVVLRDELLKRTGVEGHTVFIGAPDAGFPDVTLLNRLVALSRATGAVAYLTLDEAKSLTNRLTIDGEPLNLELPAVSGSALADRVKKIEDVHNIAVATTSMFATNDPVRPAWFDTLAQLSSTGFSDDDVNTSLAQIAAEMAALRAAIVAPLPFPFTLSGHKTVLPILLQNNSDQVLRVKVRLSSSKMTFPDNDRIETLAPHASHEVKVPVVARSNGSFDIQLQLLTPEKDERGNDVFIADPVRLTASVTTLAGLPQILTGGGLLVVLTWWYKNARESRRKRRLEQAGAGHITHPAAGGGLAS